MLAPSDIAAPLRQLAVTQANVSVELGEVTAVDLQGRRVSARTPAGEAVEIAFDFLVLATGVGPNYFGHDGFAAGAPALKTLTDAEAVRSKILQAYELAEASDDAAERARLMTFVVVGAGPTGVELAASIAQMAHITLRSNFRRINPADTRILLIEGAGRVLPTFSGALSAKAARRLGRLGVEMRPGVSVESVDATGVWAAGRRIESDTVLWTAGVQASPLIGQLGVETDRAGRAIVGNLLDVPGHPDVFVIGDAAAVVRDGHPLPGVAQVAIQEGRFVGRLLAARLAGSPFAKDFRYRDRGNMAVVGKNFAILERGKLQMSGTLTWILWAFIHVMFLPQVQNRLRVQMQWLWSYATGQRSSRLIPEPRH